MQSYEDATLTELQNGYIRGTDGALICLSCGQRFETGEVYPFGEHFYTAERALQQHLQEQHADHLEELLCGSSEILSLTDKQKELLTLFYKGLSDKETAALHVSRARESRQALSGCMESGGGEKKQTAGANPACTQGGHHGRRSLQYY